MMRKVVIIDMAPPRLVAWERSLGTFLKTSRLRIFLLKDILIIFI